MAESAEVHESKRKLGVPYGWMLSSFLVAYNQTANLTKMHSFGYNCFFPAMQEQHHLEIQILAHFSSTPTMF